MVFGTSPITARPPFISPYRVQYPTASSDLLPVVSSNEPAQRLYAALGFVEYGFEKNALKHEGRYCDEVLMAKPLQPMEVSRS